MSSHVCFSENGGIRLHNRVVHDHSKKRRDLRRKIPWYKTSPHKFRVHWTTNLKIIKRKSDMKTSSIPIILLMCSIALNASDWTTFNTSNSGLASNIVKVIVIDANGNKYQ